MYKMKVSNEAFQTSFKTRLMEITKGVLDREDAKRIVNSFTIISFHIVGT